MRDYRVTNLMSGDVFTVRMTDEAYESVINIKDGLGYVMEDILINEVSGIEECVSNIGENTAEEKAIAVYNALKEQYETSWNRESWDVYDANSKGGYQSGLMKAMSELDRAFPELKLSEKEGEQ